MTSTPDDSSRWQRLSDLLADALDRPPADHDAFLDRACGDDAALRAEAAELLRHHEAAEAEQRFEASPAARLATEAGEEARLERVGPYRLVRELGRGGMGVVYLAERDDGRFEQRVAVKVLHAGWLAPERARRFRAEGQILARLQHPHIARLYDGGVTEDGRPYLVMEPVDGEPITDFCRQRDLDLEDRLGLFLGVCEAAQYAHQNLIVHRDLKPSNILVTDEGRVKLLDFGIAKLLEDHADAALTPTTRTGLAAMTPEYAAPEQVRGEAVTTATDVYALSVVLYELLAGRRPYTFERRTPSAVERVVCEVEPARPSTAAVRAEGGAAPATEATARLARRLRGDLDTIVLKGLRKDPARRYRAADQLADDLRRFLAGLPVTARPDTLGYRMRKFAGRHRLAVGAAAAVVLALLAGLVGTAWQADRARAEAARAQAVNRFLVETLRAPDPYAGGARDVTVAEVLDRAAARVDDQFAATPDLAATVRLTLGTTLLGLGRYEPAEAELRRALALHERVHGPDAPQTAAALVELADLHMQLSRFAEADTLLSRALAIRRHYPGPHRVELARTLGAAAANALQRGDYQAALPLHQEALALFERMPRPLDDAAAESRDDVRYVLGITLHDLGRYAAADSVLGLAIDGIRSRPGPPAPFLGGALTMRAWVKDYLGEADRVEPLLREALAFRLDRFGPDHPEVGYALNDLAYVHHMRGEAEPADSLYRQALAIFRGAMGDQERTVATILNNRASLYRGIGRAEEAIPLLEEAVALQRKLLGPDHVDLSYPLNNLGHTYRSLGRLDEAIAYYRQVVAMREQSLPADHTDLGGALLALGRALMEHGRLDEAEPPLGRAVAIRTRALGPDHRDTAEAELVLARLYARRGLAEQARPLLERTLPVLREAYGPEHEQVHAARALMASLAR